MKTSTKASLALPPSTAVDSARLSIFWLEKDIQHLLARGLATPPNQIRRRAIGISPPQSLSTREKKSQRKRGPDDEVKEEKHSIKSSEVFCNCCQQCYHPAVVATGLMPPPTKIQSNCCQQCYHPAVIAAGIMFSPSLCQFQEGVVSTRLFKINIIFMLFGLF